jgi:23S rRNA pseudouridine1911/1915/1917 synthase
MHGSQALVSLETSSYALPAGSKDQLFRSYLPLPVLIQQSSQSAISSPQSAIFLMLDVLYDDNHLLVVNKPAGVPTQGAAEGEDSLVVRVKEYLKRKYDKPGNVYVGVVSRLDALVTGVIVLARTSKAAARLSEQFRESAVAKTYWAVVEGCPPQQSARLVNWVAKDDRHHRMVVVDTDNRLQAQEARLQYFRLANLPRGKTLLKVELETGRKHQIRLQLSQHGFPIVGDPKYGSSSPFPQGIALHARGLQFAHPTLRTPLSFVAPLPNSWRSVSLDEVQALKFEAESH